MEEVERTPLRSARRKRWRESVAAMPTVCIHPVVPVDGVLEPGLRLKLLASLPDLQIVLKVHIPVQGVSGEVRVLNRRGGGQAESNRMAQISSMETRMGGRGSSSAALRPRLTPGSSRLRAHASQADRAFAQGATCQLLVGTACRGSDSRPYPTRGLPPKTPPEYTSTALVSVRDLCSLGPCKVPLLDGAH